MAFTPEQVQAEIARRGLNTGQPSNLGFTQDQVLAEIKRRGLQKEKTSTLDSVINTTADVGEGFIGGLKSLGTGALQLANEAGGDTLAAFYGKLLPMIRPDLAQELSSINRQDVQKSTANVARDIQKEGADKGFAYGASKFATEIVPALAVRNPALSGALTGLLAPTQAETTGESALQRGVGTATGAALGQAAGYIVPKAINAVRNTPAAIQQGLKKAFGVSDDAVREFTAAGIDPTLAAVGGRGSKIASNTLIEAPFAGNVIQQSAQKTLADIQGKVTGIADQLSPAATQTEAGRVIQKGANEFIEGFKGKADNLYKQVDKYVPGETRVAIPNTLGTLQKFSDELADTPELAKVLQNPKIAQIGQALASDAKRDPFSLAGSLTYNGLSRLRSSIGRMLGDPVAVSDIPRSQLKQMYAALSSDMRSAAAQSGQKALQSFDRANKYYAAGIERIDNVLDDVLKLDPEKAFVYATSGTKQGATRFNAIKRSLPPEGRNALEGVMLRRLGMAKPSAQGAAGDSFSASTFLTNWNNLDDVAKKSFLGSNTALRGSLDNLLKVSSRVKDVEKLSNASGSGRVALTSALGVGGLFNPQLLAVVPSGYAGAKLMTNPKFVNWLAQSGKYTQPSQVANHIGKLAGIAAASDDDTQAAIQDYISQLTQGE